MVEVAEHQLVEVDRIIVDQSPDEHSGPPDDLCQRLCERRDVGPGVPIGHEPES